MINFLKRIEFFVQKHKTPILISIIIIVGLAIRIQRLLSSGDFWFDELVGVDLARRPLGQLLAIQHFDNSPPLYYIIIHYWRLLFGESTVAFRSFSTLISMITLIPIYQLGKYLFDKKIAIISIALFALSPYPIYHSTEARMYSLLIFFTAFSILYFLKALEKNEKKYWLLATTAVILACYTHLTALLLFPTFFVYLIFRKVDKKTWLAAGLTAIASSLAYLPWFYVFVQEKITNYQQNLLTNNWYTAVQTNVPIFLTAPINLIFEFSFDELRFHPLILLITSLMVIAPLIILAINYQSQNQHKKSILTCIIFLATPLLITSLFNSTATRYYVSNLPILVILLSFCLFLTFNQIKNQKLRFISAFVYLIILMSSSLCLYKLSGGLSQVANLINEKGVNVVLANPNSVAVKYYNPNVQIYKLAISAWGQKSINEDYLSYLFKYNWNWNKYTYWTSEDKLIIQKTVSEVTPNLPEKFAYIAYSPTGTDKQLMLELSKFYCSQTFYTNNSERLILTIYNKKSPNTECVNSEEIIEN